MLKSEPVGRQPFMTRPHQYTSLPILLCLAAAPILAQTTIGGGACTSSTLNGTYEFLLNGRQVTAAGSISKIVQAVGTATFDGLSAVTVSLTGNSVTGVQAFGTPLAYAGTYSLQSNCVGSVNITTGDIATFTLIAFAGGNTFALIGSDANFAYNGSGNLQPTTCPATLSGVHEFNANGNTLSGASVTSVLDLAGVLNFDGKGNLTANWVQVSNLVSTNVTASGPYTVNSTCLATGTLTDTANNKYAVTFSIYSTAPDFALAMSSPLLVADGSAAAAQSATGAGCSAATLNGTYGLVLNGRIVQGGVATKILNSDGSATFDGVSKVTFNLTSNMVNGSQTFGTPLTYSGTYSLQSNCQGAINITGGDTAVFSLVAYSIDAANQQARNFTLVGTDATYAYNGNGAVQPSACAVSTLSGAFPFNANGRQLSFRSHQYRRSRHRRYRAVRWTRQRAQRHLDPGVEHGYDKRFRNWNLYANGGMCGNPDPHRHRQQQVHGVVDHFWSGGGQR
jgi:hypothetical protein